MLIGRRRFYVSFLIIRTQHTERERNLWKFHRSSSIKEEEEAKKKKKKTKKNKKEMLPTVSKGRSQSSSSRPNPMFPQYLRRIVKVSLSLSHSQIFILFSDLISTPIEFPIITELIEISTFVNSIHEYYSLSNYHWLLI